MAVFLIHGNHMIISNHLSPRDYNGQPDLVNPGFVRLFLNKKKIFFQGAKRRRSIRVSHVRSG